MRRRNSPDTDAPGHDSFLDIVANIVGILIILVMVAGVRAKQLPGQTTEQAAEQESLRAAAAALEKDAAAESSLRRDVSAMIDQIEDLKREAHIRHEARAELATAVALAEREIESRREELDAGSRDDFRLRRQVAEFQSDLQHLRDEIEAAERIESTPTIVESYPTPLSKTVDEDEVHFRLKGGLVAHVPMERLVALLKQDFQRQSHKLRNKRELSGMVGPEGGYRLSYTLVKRHLPTSTQTASGTGISVVELDVGTLHPVDDRLGDPLDDALAEGSRFREVLTAYPPGATTVTIWVYEDSFAEFRRLKKTLYQLGYAAAGRPLIQGDSIKISSRHGTKSAAQ